MDWTHRDPQCVPHEPEGVRVVCAVCGAPMTVEQTKLDRNPTFVTRWRYRVCRNATCGWRMRTKEIRTILAG